MTRAPWPDIFPDVISNVMWTAQKKGDLCLKAHPLYQPAKGERDLGSALSLLDDLVKKSTIESLKTLASEAETTPILVAPAAHVEDSNNVLAIGYAHWLGHELDWPVEERVFQAKTFSKDRSDAWIRIANRSTFYGEIDRKSPYVIVDDVLTLGGTLADLRSFIIDKGGSVIGMSTIASRYGHDAPIHLGKDLQTKLEKYYGSDLEKFCNEHLGFGHQCLTRSEGEKFFGCSGYVELRKKIDGGRH